MAVPEVVTSIRIVGGVGGRCLLIVAHFARGQMHLLFHVALATACLKCEALALMTSSLLALAASRYIPQASGHGPLLSHLLALLAICTSMVSSLDH